MLPRAYRARNQSMTASSRAWPQTMPPPVVLAAMLTTSRGTLGCRRSANAVRTPDSGDWTGEVCRIPPHWVNYPRNADSVQGRVFAG